jgi:ribose-phosphate pyrophosphokinase
MPTHHYANARFFSGTAGKYFAQEITDTLGVELLETTVKKFSCGELYVKYNESVRGKDVFLFHTIRPETVNEDFMELFLLCSAAKQSFARNIHVVLPHFGYSRQDKIHDSRETISAKLMADLMVTSGANHVITLHLHADQIQGFFDVPVDNINMQKTFVEYFRAKNLDNLMVVSPDAGGAKSAKKFADELGVDLAIMHKSRPAHNVAEVTEVVGDIEGKTCILLDDMVDTAGSITAAQKALIQNGANPDVYLCATHPIFSGPAVERLNAANFTEIVVSNSIPTDPSIKNLTVLSAAPLLSSIIQNVIEDKSISGLYR